jgi:hypothetical protein
VTVFQYSRRDQWFLDLSVQTVAVVAKLESGLAQVHHDSVAASVVTWQKGWTSRGLTAFVLSIVISGVWGIVCGLRRANGIECFLSEVEGPHDGQPSERERVLKPLVAE